MKSAAAPWAFAALFGLVCFGVLEARQNPGAAPPPVSQADDQAPIRAEVTRVNMLFTVTDKHGRFITDLNKNDFQVFENKKPQQILEFTAETDLPLRLAVLVDTSNSIRDRFHFQQEAATNFINSVMRTQDKAIIVSFDTSAELAADMTNNTNVLENAVRNLRPGGGHRALRRYLLRLQGQADARSADVQVPARHGDLKRWRG